MIEKRDCHSLWLNLSNRRDWKFFSNGQSPVSRTKDSSYLLKGDWGEALGRLRDYLERRKPVVGIEVKDGLYVKFEALGKFLLSEEKRNLLK